MLDAVSCRTMREIQILLTPVSIFWLQKSKSPTCPLCKVPFDFITFRGMDKAGADGSCAVLEERIVQVRHQILDEPCLVNLLSLRTVSTSDASPGAAFD